MATSTVLKREGHSKCAKKLSNISSSSTDNSESVLSYSLDVGLALLFDCSLSKASHQHLRSKALEKGLTLYSAYDNIRQAKEECFPSLVSEWKITDYICSWEYIHISMYFIVDTCFEWLVNVCA